MRTEDVSIRYRGLDTWPAAEVASALIEGQLAAAAAVRGAQGALAAAAEAAAERLRDPAGRILYVGAGASGRIGVQDGVELFPTYGWPHERLVYLMAGGEAALVRSVEGAEDDAAGARAEIEALGLGAADVVIAVAASGRTPYAVAAAEAARARGALVIGVMNNEGAPLAGASDHPIVLLTGAEVVAGSTRMAAGTAQKAALNVLSTTIMVRLHRVYDNLMVDLSSLNVKLEKRRMAILRQVTPAPEAAAREALARSGGRIKTAALMLRGLSEEAAAALLDRTGGDLRAALEETAN
jgi:N-acetylmuramic acid 6-phosphate etherase